MFKHTKLNFHYQEKRKGLRSVANYYGMGSNTASTPTVMKLFANLQHRYSSKCEEIRCKY